jgi:hypothetical protein
MTATTCNSTPRLGVQGHRQDLHRRTNLQGTTGREWEAVT